MNSGVGFLDVLILLGALQGFIIGALLSISKEKTQGDKFFAAFLFLLSLASLNIYLLDTGFGNDSLIVAVLSAVLPIVVIMPVGPLVYFYVQSLLKPGVLWSRKDKVHFYPIIIDLIPSLLGIIYITGALLKLIDTKTDQPKWSFFIDNYNVYADIPRWISVTCYTWIARRQILKMGVSQLSWPGQLVNTLMIFQIVWLLHLIPYVTPGMTWIFLEKVGWYPIYIPLALMIYWLSIRGYIFRILNKAKKPNPVALNSESIEKIAVALSVCIGKERAFLNPSLSVDDVSKLTGIRPKTISSVINNHFQKSFNEFVNGFRVEEVKKRLLDPDQKRLTITGIALECGFNSQPTFQRTFKQMTGQTPREFQLANIKKDLISPLKSGFE